MSASSQGLTLLQSSPYALLPKPPLHLQFLSCTGSADLIAIKSSMRKTDNGREDALEAMQGIGQSTGIPGQILWCSSWVRQPALPGDTVPVVPGSYLFILLFGDSWVTRRRT